MSVKQTVILAAGESVNVVVEGSVVNVEHLVDGSGYHAVELGGMNCDLEGEMPGLYYTQQHASAEERLRRLLDLTSEEAEADIRDMTVGEVAIMLLEQEREAER